MEVLCSECGEAAAAIELLPPTDEPADPGDVGYKEWKLRVDGPVQVTHWVLRDLDAVRAAVEASSVPSLLRINPEYVNCWCRRCMASYCGEHWAPIVTEMDEGFYDATYGTCPQGHRMMLDD